MSASKYLRDLKIKEDRSLAEAANAFRRLLSQFSYKKNVSWEALEYQHPYQFEVVFKVKTICSKTDSPVLIIHKKQIDRFVLLRCDKDYWKKIIIEWFWSIERHEFDEFLKFNGELLNDPHKDDFKYG